MQRRTVRLPASGPVDIGDVLLSRGVSIGGRVRDGDGKPVGNASVYAKVQDKEVGSAQSGSDGRFRLDALPDQDLVLTALVTGFKKPSVPVARGTQNVDLVLDRGLVVSGRVVDQDGKPMGGSTIWWHRPRGSENRSGTAEVEADGSFTIGGLSPGELELEPRDSFAKVPRWYPVLKLQLARDETIEIRGRTKGARLTVKLPRGLYGRDLQLEVTGEGTPRRPTRESDGYRFDALPPGQHVLQLTLGGEPRREVVGVGSEDKTIELQR
jgi:hypothetical protein